MTTLVACAVFALPSHAQQTGIQRPRAADRIVRIFDFEEPDNPLPVPQNWIRAQHDPKVPRDRPGFPIWNGASLDRTVARSGSGSVKLPTRGGSTSLLLRSGTLSILPGADYRLSAWVRTDRLDRARAGIIARVLRDDGTEVPGSTVQTSLITSQNQWTLIDTLIVGRDGAYLQVELVVLQPEHFARKPIDRDELITLQDVEGAAWFDDIMLVQMPRIELSSNHAHNILLSSERPDVHIELRDLTGEKLSIEAQAIDATGHIVDQTHIDFPGGRHAHTWHPKLDDLGWYRILIHVLDEQRRIIGVDHLDLVRSVDQSPVLGSTTPTSAVAHAIEGNRDRARFTIVARTAEKDQLERITQLASRAGSGTVMLPLWSQDFDNDTTRLEDLLAATQHLRSIRQRVTLSIERLPDDVARSLAVDADTPLSVLARTDHPMRSLLQPMLDRLGIFVHHWQIGSLDADAPAPSFSEEQIAAAETEFRRLIPEAQLLLPWPIHTLQQPLPQNTSPRTTMLLAGAGPESSIRELVPTGQPPADQASESPSTQLTLECLDADFFGHAAAAQDFARRALLGWAAIGPRTDTADAKGGSIAVVEPWYWSEHRRPRLMPRPEIAVLRNLVERLADRTADPSLYLGPGVQAVLLEPRAGAPPDRGAALALWASPHAIMPAHLDVLLALGDVDQFDIFGNGSILPLQHESSIETRFHRVPISSDVMFIEGVDAHLLRLISSIRLNPPLIEARNALHEHAIEFTNPWPIPIRGEIYIVEPGGYSSPDRDIDRSWQILPRVHAFSLEPQASAHLPLTLTFSPFEESGPKSFIFDLQLVTDKEYGLIRIERPFPIGIPELTMSATYRRGPEPDGPHLIVDVDVVNVGDEQVSFRVSTQAPGFPRDSASVAHLGSGRSARRTFVFPDGAQTLVGELVAVSVSIPETGARLNQTVPID